MWGPTRTGRVKQGFAHDGSAAGPDVPIPRVYLAGGRVHVDGSHAAGVLLASHAERHVVAPFRDQDSTERQRTHGLKGVASCQARHAGKQWAARLQDGDWCCDSKL